MWQRGKYKLLADQETRFRKRMTLMLLHTHVAEICGNSRCVVLLRVNMCASAGGGYEHAGLQRVRPVSKRKSSATASLQPLECGGWIVVVPESPFTSTQRLSVAMHGTKHNRHG